MQTRASGVLVSLDADGYEQCRVRHNHACRGAHSDYVHPENLQVSIGGSLTIFGSPELVINVLRDLLEQSEAALAAVNRLKEVV